MTAKGGGGVWLTEGGRIIVQDFPWERGTSIFKYIGKLAAIFKQLPSTDVKGGGGVGSSHSEKAEVKIPVTQSLEYTSTS